jgi:hypothetical protein
MDFESAQVVKQVWPPPSEENSLQCQSGIVTRTPDSAHIEIGYDDGTAEWKTPLLSDTERVKKTLCLPENINAYHKASLLLFINRGSKEGGTLTVGINAEIREISASLLPHSPAWYEIPLTMSLVEGSPIIQVFVRTSGANSPEEALEIWGDAHSPTHDSEYNFRHTNDLSSEAGAQTGEYMIRLALER